MMRVLDLFSGIGAFSLGLERAGMRTVAFCEIDLYCRRVLAKHWPEVPCYDDVRSLTAGRLRADGISVDVICGGFPCQDISVAGKGAGIRGERSGLWSEFARLIGEIRPRYVLVENVAALLGRGLGDVLGDLAALGYDAEWHCIPASAVGAPHRRDRIWIVSHDAQRRWGDESAAINRGSDGSGRPQVEDRGLCGNVADAEGDIRRASWDERPNASDRCGTDVADAGRAGLSIAKFEGWHRGLLSQADIGAAAERCSGWAVEPDVGRVAHGVASRVDRLRGLGNSLVPQIPELIGRAILAQVAA
jgi:DNA (cytosine-5)-methyltransferase 1